MFGANLPATLKANVLAVQSWIASAFYLFILFTSNPFRRLAEVPVEGRDLNPILQDFGLAVHPPMLYLGYVGFSIAFSFAVAALIEGRIDAAWARWVRPWTLLAWMCLTLGIAMGSYWAYYELGWGGWWFWDPVENASLMPWIAGTALLHSAVVMEKRNSLKVWTILLAILTFSLSLIGTFLVRSGVLTSVHTFSTDPARGLFILVILMAFIGGSLALFAWRAPLLKQGGLFAPISRESALVFNNLFLATACATVFVGTLYPLVLEALTGDKISVGAPFFNLTFGPLFVPLLVAVPFGPLLAWKRGDLYGVAQRLLAACAVAMVGLAATFAFAGTKAVLAPFGIGLALFVMAGALTDIAERVDLRSLSLETIGRRAAGLPRSAWGTAVAHFALGITLLGIVCASTWGSERIVALKPTQTVSISGYDLSFRRHGEPGRLELPRDRRALHGAQGRHGDRRHGAVETHLPVARWHVDHRGGAADARRQPALSVARRQQCRRIDRGAALPQAAGAADLARGVGDGAGRRAVVVGPQVADRRAEAGGEDCGAAGGIIFFPGSERLRRNRLTGQGSRTSNGLERSVSSGGAGASRRDAALCRPGRRDSPRSGDWRLAPARSRSDLRCMVCQNQSIDDSEAPLARDLRLLVRERLKAGDSDTQVVDYMVARYGEFVLLKPRVSWHTAILWGAPLTILIIGLFAIGFSVLRRSAGTRAPRSCSTQRRGAAKAERHRAVATGRRLGGADLIS